MSFLQMKNKGSSIKTQSFSQSEDELIKQLYEYKGIGDWKLISSYIKNKSPANCKERYLNHLASSLKHEEWSTEENERLLKLIEKYGKKWTMMSEELIGRSPTQIKNHWYRNLMKKANDEILDNISRSSSNRIARLEFPPNYQHVYQNIGKKELKQEENKIETKHTNENSFYKLFFDDVDSQSYQNDLFNDLFWIKD
jgi:hypothetical protein